MFFLSPIEHFEINYLGMWQYNSSYFILETISFYIFLIIIPIIFIFISFSSNFNILKKNKIFFLFNNIYNFILNDIIKLQINSVRAYRYFPIIFNIFFIILVLNLSSLFPYTISVTGQLIITFGLAFTLFGGIIIIAILTHKKKFIEYFIPKDVPVYLIGFLTIIEFFSFLIRPFSLSIRLFANMLAGHTLLNIFASFTYFVFYYFNIFFLLPLMFCIAVVFLELGVAVIQAYVFTILIAIYLNDIINIGNH